MSLPYLVRLRQCIIEYSHQGNMHRRPLYNALKYASAFPAIYLSAALGSVSTDMASDDKPLSIFASTNTIFRLWLLAATINSLYSFWWDVTNDWGMDLFKLRDDDEQVARSSSRPRRLLLPRLHSGTPLVSRSSSSIDLQEAASIRTLSETTNHKRYYHPYGLRSLLHFPLTVYPFVILLNLVLRLTWSMKLFSVVNVNSHAGMANFCLKVAELFRRWMWVFVRVEWEMIKKGQEGHTKVRTDESSAYEMVSPGSAEPH
ncbi:hypothetical protein H0H93_011779 [Arthromyces matolae]|nr:hypothetical protein H0H93_011779 [Arthromyces matolae]